MGGSCGDDDGAAGRLHLGETRDACGDRQGFSPCIPATFCRSASFPEDSIRNVTDACRFTSGVRTNRPSSACSATSRVRGSAGVGSGSGESVDSCITSLISAGSTFRSLAEIGSIARVGSASDETTSVMASAFVRGAIDDPLLPRSPKGSWNGSSGPRGTDVWGAGRNVPSSIAGRGSPPPTSDCWRRFHDELVVNLLLPGRRTALLGFAGS